jgi:hypothetical protein
MGPGVRTPGGVVRAAVGAGERRWGQRRLVSGWGEICRPSGYHREGPVRDVGLEGIFVYVSCIGLSRGDEVELRFALEGCAAARPFRLRAWIMHTSSEGVGLMFRDFHSEAFRLIDKLIHP